MKIEQRFIHGRSWCVFHVPTRDGLVFMKQENYASQSDEYFIVFVDRMRFESVWFKCGSRVVPELARGNEVIWRKDYKFHHAEKGFSHGITNPVPLATLSAYSGYPHISFIDGITRTIWLLANGTEQFPVFVYDENTATNLHNYIGVKASKILSNNALFLRFNE